MDVYDVAWAEGKGDIEHSQGTDLDVHSQKPYNDFIMLQHTFSTNISTL